VGQPVGPLARGLDAALPLQHVVEARLDAAAERQSLAADIVLGCVGAALRRLPA
jgi:hypothetical protein